MSWFHYFILKSCLEDIILVFLNYNRIFKLNRILKTHFFNISTLKAYLQNMLSISLHWKHDSIEFTKIVSLRYDFITLFYTKVVIWSHNFSIFILKSYFKDVILMKCSESCLQDMICMRYFVDIKCHIYENIFESILFL